MITPITPLFSHEAQTTPFPIGSQIGDKYRVQRVLGHGGMGIVYKAANTDIGRVVAVKVLHAHLSKDEVVRARFEREARSAALVRHPNVVEVLDMGATNDRPYIVMEYVRGVSVAETLESSGAFAPSTASRIAGHVLSGLEALHQVGVVHRDLKPENVMLVAGGGVKLFDLGVAAQLIGGQDLTPSGLTMGTPHYVSPEQLRGDRVRDPRVDVYGVGVLLFEMLAGSRPFVAKNVRDLLSSILNDAPPPMRAFRTDVPFGLESVVRRALVKDADARYPNARAMMEALIPYGASPPDPENGGTDDGIDLRTLNLRERRRTIAHHVAPKLGPLPRLAIASVLRSEESLDGGFSSKHQLSELERGGTQKRSRVVRAGRVLAKLSFDQPYPTPEAFFQEVTHYYARFMSGTAHLVRSGEGFGVLEVTGMDAPNLSASVLFLGFLREAVELCGGRHVEAQLPHAKSLGDPIDRYEVTWSR